MVDGGLAAVCLIDWAAWFQPGRPWLQPAAGGDRPIGQLQPEPLGR